MKRSGGCATESVGGRGGVGAGAASGGMGFSNISSIGGDDIHRPAPGVRQPRRQARHSTGSSLPASKVIEEYKAKAAALAGAGSTAVTGSSAAMAAAEAGGRGNNRDRENIIYTPHHSRKYGLSTSGAGGLENAGTLPLINTSNHNKMNRGNSGGVGADVLSRNRERRASLV